MTTSAETPKTKAKPKGKKSNKPVALSFAVGRRKTSSARVRLFDGTGQIQINGLASIDYLQRPTLQMMIMQPLEAMECASKYDILVNAKGGGKAGQAGAIRHGISRALAVLDETMRVTLRKDTFLTRDSRMKERKKYGQRGARRRFQFSKR